MSFAEKLKELRIANNISQKELAEKIGVAQSSINYWEKGQRDPSLTVVKKIADYFGIAIDDFLDEGESMSEFNENGEIHYIKKVKKSDIDRLQKYFTLTTLAAHFDGEQYTEEELKEIKQFIEFVKSKRNA